MISSNIDQDVTNGRVIGCAGLATLPVSRPSAAPAELGYIGSGGGRTASSDGCAYVPVAGSAINVHAHHDKH